MSNFNRWSLATAVLMAAAAAGYAGPARAAIISGQVDTFEDGGLSAWQAGGASNPNGPANVATGGPAGANDNFLRLTSNGQAAAGGKLVAFNSDQWGGDYVAAGVNAIRMQVNNLGATALSLRLIFVGTQSLTTVANVDVPAGSGWTTVNFPLTPANLSGGDFATGMSGVVELNLVHSPDVITGRGASPNIAAQLGVDNVTAVPEPGAATILAGAMAGAGWLATSRSTRRRKG